MTKNSYLSVYYEDGIYHKVESICQKSRTLLIIDLQNTYANLGKTENTPRFKDFAKRLENTFIPNTKKLLFEFRRRKMPVIYC